ncbi:MAG: hypothetical protein EXQ52_05950 [Bryobacterales bacterium]|nr:hypothetical protein [Bryobacterales bacterium]
MTALLVVLAFLLLVLFGFLPTILLVRDSSSGNRILLTPILGLCMEILVTNFLAVFRLTGFSIAVISLTLFVALAVGFPFRRGLAQRFVSPEFQFEASPARRFFFDPVADLSREEIKRGAVPMVIAVATTVLISWPLMLYGHGDYWGFANPDAAFYMKIVERLYTQSFSVPGIDEAYGYGSSISRTHAVLGVSYFPSILSALSGIAPKYFFNILCAVVTGLTPLSLYFLATFGFKISRRVALIAAIMIGCSPLLANSYYISALGSLCLGILVPVGVAFCIQYLAEPSRVAAILLATVTAAMFYCYYPGFGMMAILYTAIVGSALIQGRISFKQLRFVALSLAVLIAGTFSSQFYLLAQQLFIETFSGRLQAGLANETTMFFGLCLTEEFVPFLWGLKFPAMPVALGSLSSDVTFLVLFGLGALYICLLLLSTAERLSGLRREYKLTSVAIILSLAAYMYSRNGYAVFKLVGWTQSFILIGLAAITVGIADLLERKQKRLLAAAPLVLLAVYIGLSLTHTAELGLISARPGEKAIPHNAGRFELSDFRTLEQLDAKWGPKGFNIALPDPVAQRWAVPFLTAPKLQFLPILGLEVENSDSRQVISDMKKARDRFETSYVMVGGDVIANDGRGACQSLWSNRVFTLIDVARCQNVVAMGPGWYRMERNPKSPDYWQRQFRWLRKRGVLLILNPSRQPQRLRFTATSGYGNPSPYRTVRLYADGELFDEIQIRGYARVTTKPFTGAGPWSRIEFMVEEDAKPLPRRYPFWSAWVPRDARSLNLAVADIALEPDGPGALPTSSRIEFRSTEQFGKTLINGIYPDRWAGSKASVELAIPTGAKTLEVSGTIPAVKSFSFPYSVRLLADGDAIGEQQIAQPGPFKIRFSLRPTGRAAQTFEILPASTYVASDLGIGSDTRPLSVQLDRIAVTTDALAPVSR